ncbi:MAG: hypothetical protein ACI3Y5_08820 [Prevotella sp.]
MKKIFMVMAAVLVSLSVSAFEFDGIDLNGNFVDITRQISQKGYVYDDAMKCLKGNCQGNEIFLSVNNTDVTEKNRLGQLIVEIPMNNNSFEEIIKTFNVVYHQIEKTTNASTYKVSDDGTKLVVSKTVRGISLTYNTPYYKTK